LAAAVLSIGKLTVEQSRYYERQVAQGRDDYYSGRGESPGRWTGSGAETLRLDSPVDDEGFMALMEGRDPGTGERLKRIGGRSKVAAFDLTFSAPKSVSVLFAIGEPTLARALVEAHESAVDAALGYLEREACRVRRGRGGAARQVGYGPRHTLLRGLVELGPAAAYACGGGEHGARCGWPVDGA
jgi:conjugative relaxase-like TrwC/TraI family protein